MSEQLPEVSAILTRLEKLEKENCRLKRGGVVVLLLLRAAVLMGQARASKTVNVEQFNLKDTTGKIRAMLRVARD